MKSLITLLILVVSATTWAATNEVSYTQEENTPYTLEPSFSFSSINDGSQFLSMAFTGRVLSWLRLGMEFDLPANFDEDAQIYQARVLGRIMLLDRRDKVYLQGSGTYAVFNYTLADIDPNAQFLTGDSQTDSFFTVEAMAGYTRVLSDTWSVGGRLGVQYAQYSPALAAAGFDWEGDFFYNRATVFGTYVF